MSRQLGAVPYEDYQQLKKLVEQARITCQNAALALRRPWRRTNFNVVYFWMLPEA
jgi:hypothetical protein